MARPVSVSHGASIRRIAQVAAPTSRCTEALVAPIELDGPKCGEGGPSVDIVKAAPYRCGKGDTCTRVEMRIRNPEARALFLLTDPSEPFSGYLESISILFGRKSPNTPVWEFLGQSYHQAFKVSPGADVVIRKPGISHCPRGFRGGLSRPDLAQP